MRGVSKKNIKRPAKVRHTTRRIRSAKASGRKPRPEPAERSYFQQGARDAAAILGSGSLPQDPDSVKLLLNESWSRCWQRSRRPAASEEALQAGKAYAQGFAETLHLPQSGSGWLPVVLNKTASAVVLAGPDYDAGAVSELMRLPLRDVFVVLEEAAGPHLLAAIRATPGVTVVDSAQPPGTDAGRALGARMAHTDIVLFADGRTRIAAERLAPFLAAVDGGADVAIVNRAASLGTFRSWDDLSRVNAFVNLSLGRQDLKSNSAEELPNAWSRRAIDAVGSAALAVPALSHRIAVERKLSIRLCPDPHGRAVRSSPAQQGYKPHIFTGYITALQTAMNVKGARLSLPDKMRRRSAAEGWRG